MEGVGDCLVVKLLRNWRFSGLRLSNWNILGKDSVWPQDN